MTAPRRQPGFTLIELVLVLVILTLALSAVAPSLRGWGRGARLGDAADGFVAAAQWARSQAIAEAAVYQMELDAAGGGYAVSVQRGGEFVAAAGEFGQPVALPPGLRLEATAPAPDGPAGAAAIEAIEFQPTGRATPAAVRFINNEGETTEVRAATAAEPFRVTGR